MLVAKQKPPGIITKRMKPLNIISLFRNGLGDNSYFVWPGNLIPYVIDPSFNETNFDNIREAVEDFNTIFDGCIKWVEKSDEVRLK
jgi:hypothetical protein